MDWVMDTPNGEALKVGTHKIFRYTVPSAYDVKIEPEKSSDDRWNRIKKLFDRL
jgi:hypothetical protein